MRTLVMNIPSYLIVFSPVVHNYRTVSLSLTHCFQFSSCNLFQVYYLPIQTIYNQVTLPTMLAAMPLLREIVIREGITILHGHGVSGKGEGRGGGVGVSVCTYMCMFRCVCVCVCVWGGGGGGGGGRLKILACGAV